MLLTSLLLLMLHGSIRFPLQNTSFKIKILRISIQQQQSIRPRTRSFWMWVLYDYTGCTPMKQSLKQYFPSASSPLASMSVLLFTSSLTHFSKQFINTCLYSSLSVGMPRDRYSIRIVLHPHLPPPTALKLDNLGGFLEKNPPTLCNPPKLHWWVHSMLKVSLRALDSMSLRKPYDFL